MKFFEWLDSIRFLNLHAWDFSVRSAVREYGREFTKRVILLHPIRTLRGVQHYRRLYLDGDAPKGCLIPSNRSRDSEGEGRSVVGVGFCLKPLAPACISGRSNHDCLFLEKNLHRSPEKTPECCRDCAIKDLGTLALASGNAFYIMTSARDILFDLMLPSLNRRQFTDGAFILCRYSYDPFAIALCIAGVSGRLFPYEKNDCRDYETWRLADVGIKEERTEIHERDYRAVRELLSNAKGEAIEFTVERRGNIYYRKD